MFIKSILVLLFRQYLDCRTGCIAESKGDCGKCVSKERNLEWISLKLLLSQKYREGDARIFASFELVL